MTPDEIARLPYRPCVGVVLTNGAGEVFAGERIDSPGAWQMPQGGIDGDETPADAAWRELWEETGVRAEDARFVAETADWVTYDLPHDIVPRIWKGRFRGQKQKWILFRFLGSDTGIRIDGDHPEFSAWRWIAPGDLLEQIVPFKQSVYQRVFSEFRDLI